MTSRQSGRNAADPQISIRPTGPDQNDRLPAAPAPISSPIPQDELAGMPRLSAAPVPPSPSASSENTDLAPAESGNQQQGGTADDSSVAETPEVAEARRAYEAARDNARRMRREAADEAAILTANSLQSAAYRAWQNAIAGIKDDSSAVATPTPPAAPATASPPDTASGNAEAGDTAEGNVTRPPLAMAYEMLGMTAGPVPTAKDALKAMNTVVISARKSNQNETLALARAAREIALERIKAEKAEQAAAAATAAVTPAASTPASQPPTRIEVPSSPMTGQLFRPTVKPARFMPRHLAIAATFVLVVLLPAVIMAAYLWTRAADQYASQLGFSVHQENSAAAASILTGLSAISGSSSPDTDILYQYLQSQDLVSAIDKELDLKAIWSKPARDPVFTYHGATIEDLTDYWSRMVTVYYNQNARLIEVRVKAFEPQDAKLIADAILAQSTLMINRLNEVAAADAVRYADEELAKTREGLVLARQKLTAFRNQHQFVSPESEAAAQSGIIAGLEEQLVTAYIELDTLRQNGNSSDPRINVVERRIKVIEDRIAAERSKVGAGQGDGSQAFVSLVSEYERLAADVLFAENAYNAARSALDGAQIEARRQNRYLAAHIRPTLAEAARYPERLLLLGVASVFLLMAWAVGALFFYSLRDRH